MKIKDDLSYLKEQSKRSSPTNMNHVEAETELLKAKQQIRHLDNEINKIQNDHEMQLYDLQRKIDKLQSQREGDSNKSEI